MIDAQRLKDISDRVAKATEWTPEECQFEVEDDGYVNVEECATLGETMVMMEHDYEGHGEDWLFLSHVREDVPFLLECIAELQRELTNGK